MLRRLRIDSCGRKQVPGQSGESVYVQKFSSSQRPSPEVDEPAVDCPTTRFRFRETCMHAEGTHWSMLRPAKRHTLSQWSVATDTCVRGPRRQNELASSD